MPKMTQFGKLDAAADPRQGHRCSWLPSGPFFNPSSCGTTAMRYRLENKRHCGRDCFWLGSLFLLFFTARLLAFKRVKMERGASRKKLWFPHCKRLSAACLSSIHRHVSGSPAAREQVSCWRCHWKRFKFLTETEIHLKAAAYFDAHWSVRLPVSCSGLLASCCLLQRAALLDLLDVLALLFRPVCMHNLPFHSDMHMQSSLAHMSVPCVMCSVCVLGVESFSRCLFMFPFFFHFPKRCQRLTGALC